MVLGQVGQELQLLRVQNSVGDLDPLHAGGVPVGVRAFGGRASLEADLLALHAVVSKAVVVALSINAPPESGLREELFFDFPFPTALQLKLEYVDLFGEIFWHSVF